MSKMMMAGLNPVDIILASGHIPAIALPLPGVVGIEGVGTTGGKRVYFGRVVSPFGSLAQRTLVDAAETFDVPAGFTNEQAITIGAAASTAYVALSWRAKIQPGEHVIGAAATVTLDGDVPSTVAGLAEAWQGRVNVIIDLIWNPYATAALLVASPGARRIATGFASAAETSFSPAVVMRQQASIEGFSMLTVPVEVRLEAYSKLATYALAGKLKLPTEVYTLADLATAWDRQQESPNGKVILDLQS